jgi:hypothetical protein
VVLAQSCCHSSLLMELTWIYVFSTEIHGRQYFQRKLRCERKDLGCFQTSRWESQNAQATFNKQATHTHTHTTHAHKQGFAFFSYAFAPPPTTSTRMHSLFRMKVCMWASSLASTSLAGYPQNTVEREKEDIKGKADILTPAKYGLIRILRYYI